MIRSAALALLSHWRRAPGQFLTLVLGLALATALWSAVQAINAEARANYDAAANKIDAGNFQVLISGDGRIPLATYVRLRRAGWLVTPVLEGPVKMGDHSFRVQGVDVLNYPALPVDQTNLSGLSIDNLVLSPGRLFANPQTAALIANTPNSPPVIETDALPPDVVVTDISTAETLLQVQGWVSRLLVLPAQPRDLPLLNALAPELTLSTPVPAANVSQLTDSFHLNLTAFGFLAFAVGLFVVHGTIGLAFQQRRGVFRTLRALGLPQRTLTMLVSAELLVLAVLSGLIGLIIGYFVAAALLPDVAAAVRGLYGASIDGALTLRPVWVISGLGMAVAGTGLAAAHGLWETANQPILASPRISSGLLSAAKRSARLALWGFFLLGLGILGYFSISGIIGGFALLGGMLLASAFVLPLILHGALSAAGHNSNGALSLWFWSDMRAQLPGLSLALMALLLALATNIGVSTMVSSFRLTFTNWLDQRLAPELYVTAIDDRQGQRIASWLEERVDAVLPIRYVQTALNGHPARIYGMIDHATYREHWPLLQEASGVWDLVHDGQAVLINEQLARRFDLWTGDNITLMPGWRMPIAGVYSDYGNPIGQVRVSLDLLTQKVPSLPNQQFAVRAPAQSVPTLSHELHQNFDLPPGAVLDQARIKAQSLAIFDKTFLVTGALNVLTLGVAAFAILTSLLTLWTMRLPQLAPVWAMGETRARLAWIEVLRSVGFAGLTAIAAIPLGLILAWVLLSVINVEAFGWKLPMYFFPLDWARLFVLSLLAGAIAAIIPARRLNRMPPANLLKVFANER